MDEIFGRHKAQSSAPQRVSAVALPEFVDLKREQELVLHRVLAS
jgi:hypothetical protein